jgi:hypothetical protein
MGVTIMVRKDTRLVRSGHLSLSPCAEFRLAPDAAASRLKKEGPRKAALPCFDVY